MVADSFNVEVASLEDVRSQLCGSVVRDPDTESEHTAFGDEGGDEDPEENYEDEEMTPPPVGGSRPKPKA